MEVLQRPVVLAALSLWIGGQWALHARFVSVEWFAVLAILLAAMPGRWRYLSGLGLGALLVLNSQSDRTAGLAPVPVTAQFVRTEGWRRVDQHGTAVSQVRGRIEWAIRRGRVLRLGRAGELEWRSSAPPPEFVRVRLKGLLSLRPDHGALRGQAFWWLGCKSERLLLVERERGGLLLQVRERLGGRQGQGGLSSGSRLVRGMVFGARDELPLLWVATLRRFGLSHVTAISGLHVGLLGGVVWWCLPMAAPRHRLLAVVLIVWGYALLAGARPAAMRAAVMISAAGTASLFGRRGQALNGLALAVLTLLGFDIRLVADSGFLLSVGATAGILGYVDGLSAARQTAKSGVGRLSDALAVSCAAQWATLPLTVPWFSSVSALSAINNLVALPWVVGVIALGLVWGSLEIGWGLGGLVEGPLDGMAGVLETVAAWSPHWIVFRPLEVPDSALVLLAAAGLVLLRFWRHSAWVLMAVLVLLPGSPPVERFGMTMIDVGQGDAILLHDAGDFLLIDAGGMPGRDIAAGRLLRAFARLGVERLDELVVTHPDLDHCQGGLDLRPYLIAEMVRSGGGWPDHGCVGRLRELAGESFGEVAASTRWRWRGWSLEVLPEADVALASANDRSLVLRAAAGGRVVLLTGDIGVARESDLLRSCRRCLAADILKVGHHGSRFSSSTSFLKEVGAEWSLISVGRNSAHGHPAQEALDRLERSRSRVLRTDLLGDIQLHWMPGGPIKLQLGEPRDW